MTEPRAQTEHSEYRDRIGEALNAVEIRSDISFTWFGKPSPALPPTARKALTPKTARGYLLYQLQNRLYSDFYCAGFAAETTPAPPVSAAGGEAPFVEALSGANRGTGSLQAGWEVVAIEEGTAGVRRDGLTLYVKPDECVLPPDRALEPGTTVGLRFPKEMLNISPGFYMALGDAPEPDDSGEPLLRWYWNLSAGGAAELVGLVTEALNEEQVPFRLKVINEPRSYLRCDAAVLYLRRRYYDRVAARMRPIYRRLRPRLGDRAPAFARWLAPGLGLAEDPDPGGLESFGTHRCRLVADGIIRASEQSRATPEGKLAAVAERFAEEGLDINAPYLNAGSADDYAFQVQP